MIYTFFCFCIASPTSFRTPASLYSSEFLSPLINTLTFKCTCSSVVGPNKSSNVIMNRVMLINVCITENFWLGVSATTLWPLVGSPCPIDTYCLNGGTCTYYETVAELVCQWVTHPLSLSLFSLTLSFIPLRPSPIVTLKTYASVVPCRELRQVTAKRPILLGWHHSAAADGKNITSHPPNQLKQNCTQDWPRKRQYLS